MRMTLHLAAAEDFPAYAQLAPPAPDARRGATTYPRPRRGTGHRAISPRWLATPRTNPEIRERVASYDGAPQDPNMPILCARTLLPLVQLPPAGHWRDTTRGARFVLDPRPLPDAADAAALVLHPLPRGVRPGQPARRRRAGRASPSATSRGSASRPSPTATRRASSCSTCRAGRSRPRDTHAPAALPRPLGPAAAGLRRPRPDHPARGPAAEAHAERRLHRHRRRPRRRQLDASTGRELTITPHTDFDHARRPRRGAADRPLLRARGAPSTRSSGRETIA